MAALRPGGLGGSTIGWVSVNQLDRAEPTPGPARPAPELVETQGHGDGEQPGEDPEVQSRPGPGWRRAPRSSSHGRRSPREGRRAARWRRPGRCGREPSSARKGRPAGQRARRSRRPGWRGASRPLLPGRRPPVGGHWPPQDGPRDPRTLTGWRLMPRASSVVNTEGDVALARIVGAGRDQDDVPGPVRVRCQETSRQCNSVDTGMAVRATGLGGRPGEHAPGVHPRPT